LDNKASTITGQNVGAELISSQSPAAASGIAPSTAPAEVAPAQMTQGGIAMGSAMKIDRLHCTDAIVIHTENRDVDCDMFDYDVRNRFAVIAAYPGRFATVKTRGSTSVNTAQRMEWNMLRDSVTIINATGSSPR
ncbi:MAG TPA: hypothetical protein VG711_04605, partial [Phycisphaerales bacterium]|nr:hypothetical protein [Phycisphaerales bacterium]